VGSTDPNRVAVGCAFGPFFVDFVRRLVWRDGVPVPLHGKSFEVLAYLIAHRDRIVTKDDLLREVWPDTFVQENNLSRHVSTVRRALGQQPDEHEFILTVQGRGYRFVAPIVDLNALPADLPSGRTLSSREVEGAGSAEEAPDPPTAAPEAPVSNAWSGAASRPRTFAWWLAAAGAAMVTLYVASWGLRDLVNPQERRVLRPLTYGPGAHVGPTWAPDGQSLAYASDRDGNFDVFIIQSPGRSDPIQVTTSPHADWQPAWSPDGQWLAFRSERDGGGIFVVSASGAAERRLTNFGFEPRWSPDGRLILFTSSQYARPRPRAFVVALDGSSPRQVRADLTAGLQTRAFGWHPDGRVSALGVTRDSRWLLSTAPLEGGLPVASVESASIAAEREALDLSLGRFVWGPEGRALYIEGRSHGVGDLWRLEVARATLAWRGTFERLTTGQDVDRTVAVSADGRRVAFESVEERTRIWSFPILAETGEVAEEDGSPITPGSAGEFDAAVSRDGRQLVYRTVRGGRQELWQHSMLDGRERRLIADPAAFRSSPRWSPDGARLTYLASARRPMARTELRQATLGIFSAADGGERLLPAINTAEFIPDDWSSDGRWILGACRARETSQWSICLVPVDGAGEVQVLVSDPERSLHNARYAPDHRWVSFTAYEPGTAGSALYVRPVGGGQTTAVTDGAAFVDKAHWAPDGRTLYFVSDQGGFLNVWARRFDPAGGRPIGPAFQVTRFDGLRRAFAPDLNVVDMAVTADRLFVPVTEVSSQIWVLDDIHR
jgi:Tol biopolymer transport system component/DNA-binding winged helix-turn-helix (wHTH) protein